MRRDLALAGAALVVVGLAVSLSPSPALAAGLTSRTLAALGALVAALGVAAAVLVPREAERRADDRDGDRSEPPVRRLGGEFDDALARTETMSSTRLRRAEEPGRLRERLREAAVAAVAVEKGIERERAAGLVERGEWTDDPVAAAFLSADRRAPLGTRLREALSTTPRVVSRARRTAEELEGRP